MIKTEMEEVILNSAKAKLSGVSKISYIFYVFLTAGSDQ
jgi:hypothetical protein